MTISSTDATRKKQNKNPTIIQTDDPAQKKELTLVHAKTDDRLDHFLALPTEDQEPLRKMFGDSLSSPLKEMWNKNRQTNNPTTELKPIFIAPFIEMLQLCESLKETI